jgi:glycosyltransferase involved in cell wall biosynthesis
MNILITNIWLSNHAGTEVGVRDLAIALHKRGIHIEVYSPELGAVANEIRNAGVHVVDSTRDLIQQPDLIHAQHFIPSMDAMARFPGVPAVYFLHDRLHPSDTPPKYSQVARYVAVDYNCLDRLIIDNGIEEKDTFVLYNWVDTDRFKLRGHISNKPSRALVFSNYATKDNYFRVLQEACERSNIGLDGTGRGFNNEVADPENIMHNYDIVFAKAKAAMEALATGAGVILCDTRGLGEFVTRENFSHFRKYNFGMRTLTRPVETGLVLAEINKYGKDKILEAALLIRKDASFTTYLEKILEIYRSAIREYHQRKDTGRNTQDIATIREYLSQKNTLIQKKMDEISGYSSRNTEQFKHEKDKQIRHYENMIRERDIITGQIKKSWSYRLGRFLTFPARYFYELFKK